MKNGRPDFHAVASRSLMSNQFRIELALQDFPVSFVAYDILYLNGESLVFKPLIARKKLLFQTVKEDEGLDQN